MKNAVRPLDYQPADGEYNGKILKAQIKELVSKKFGERDHLTFLIQIETEDGILTEKFFSPPFSWHKSSLMLQTLANLEALPEPGEELDLSALIDMPVIVEVQNQEVDGVIYTNITSLKKRSVLSPGRKLPKPRPLASTTAGAAEDLFQDEQE